MQVSGVQHRDSQLLKVIVHLWASPVVQTVKNLPTMQETQIQSPGREDLLEKEWLGTPVLLPKDFCG